MYLQQQMLRLQQMSNCEYGKEIVQGLTRFIECQKTNKPCAFQRYCPTEKRCVNLNCYATICKILEKERGENDGK